ncbi:E3 ubiquitin-protein ligase TRIM45-like [Saccostrea cucullata]|uniref:E3 ubiquitin-protein ligase TRIM45-like n=1 Tax=Saccostrea cuccullata TaxID=36930 RepID=UPI002ED46239
MDEVPDTAQHFIECDTESCRNFSEFYCNKCHQPLCDHCREAHLKKKKHEIVLYQERKRKLPSEKCRIHPTNDIDIYCTFCQDPLCSTCFAQDHSGHAVTDLETIYNDILQQCQKKISKIWNTVIPGAKNDVESMRKNAVKKITKLRFFMKKRADELKKVVDSLLSDNNKKLDVIENSVLNDINEHQKKTEDYMKILEKITTDYESKLSSVKHTELMKFHLDISLATLKIPKKAEPKLPILKLGTLNKKRNSKTVW